MYVLQTVQNNESLYIDDKSTRNDFFFFNTNKTQNIMNV